MSMINPSPLSDNPEGGILTTGNPKPSTDVVSDFHTYSDVDVRAESQHHTLGPNRTQASPGDHKHDGGDSALLLEGYTISGIRGSDAWALSINDILVRLGATNNSTAP